LLKKEEVYCKTYKDSKDAYQSIFEYIESWYNHRRKHSSLGYQTPDEVHAGSVA
jgi:putative transposase